MCHLSRRARLRPGTFPVAGSSSSIRASASSTPVSEPGTMHSGSYCASRMASQRTSPSNTWTSSEFSGCQVLATAGIGEPWVRTATVRSPAARKAGPYSWPVDSGSTTTT